MVHCAWRAPGGKPLTSRVVRNHCCARHQNTPPRDRACAAAAAFWGVGSLTDGKLFSEYFCHHSRLIQRKEKQICCLLDFIILKMSMLLGWLAAALKKPVTLSHHIKPWETVMVDFLFIYFFFFTFFDIQYLTIRQGIAICLYVIYISQVEPSARSTSHYAGLMLRGWGSATSKLVQFGAILATTCCSDMLQGQTAEGWTGLDERGGCGQWGSSILQLEMKVRL